MANRNAEFLSKINTDTKDEILNSIGRHYGISAEAAEAEVSADQAEHLLDYMIEPYRSAALVLMQMHGIWP